MFLVERLIHVALPIRFVGSSGEGLALGLIDELGETEVLGDTEALILELGETEELAELDGE